MATHGGAPSTVVAGASTGQGDTARAAPPRPSAAPAPAPSVPVPAPGPVPLPESATTALLHSQRFPNCEAVSDGEGSVRYLLPLRKKLLYAWPGFAYYAMRYLRSTQMKKFYTDHVGVPVWWIALVVSIAVSIDALSDPLIGFLSDTCRWERHGEPMRRRPFIAVGSLVMGALYLPLWGICLSEDNCMANKPTVCEDQSEISGPAIFFMLFYVLYFCSLALVSVPYEALGAELTPDHGDRSNLMALYTIGNVLGILVAVVAPSLVDGSEKTGYFALALVFVVIFVAGAMSVASRLRELRPPAAAAAAAGAGAGAGAGGSGALEVAKGGEAPPPPPPPLVLAEAHSPAVPAMLNCLRNRVFRVLLLNQVPPPPAASTAIQPSSHAAGRPSS
jgi:Na+/melibiose symporter-like transporter